VHGASHTHAYTHTCTLTINAADVAVVHGHVSGDSRLWDWPIDRVGGDDSFTQMVGFGARHGRQCGT
jgi:hypothetical protein